GRVIRILRSRPARPGRGQERSASGSPYGDRRHKLVCGRGAELSPPHIPLLLALGAVTVCCALVLAPSARAVYGPTAGGFGADIVSVERAAEEQADAPTSDAVVSADGRYVVFQTRATNFFENDGVANGDPESPGIM